MAQDKTIGELTEQTALNGNEAFAVETEDGNSKVTSDTLRGYAGADLDFSNDFSEDFAN